MTDLEGSLKEQLKHCFEANRRATFKKWVFGENVPCSATKLAEAGFIFAGNDREPDVVKCFFCGKVLDCWDEDDDPWGEHQKHAPHCTFAKLDKPESALTLSEFIDLRNELYLTQLKSQLMEKLNKDFEIFNVVTDKIKTPK